MFLRHLAVDCDFFLSKFVFYVLEFIKKIMAILVGFKIKIKSLDDNVIIFKIIPSFSSTLMAHFVILNSVSISFNHYSFEINIKNY